MRYTPRGSAFPGAVVRVCNVVPQARSKKQNNYDCNVCPIATKRKEQNSFRRKSKPKERKNVPFGPGEPPRSLCCLAPAVPASAWRKPSKKGRAGFPPQKCCPVLTAGGGGCPCRARLTSAGWDQLGMEAFGAWPPQMITKLCLGAGARFIDPNCQSHLAPAPPQLSH